MCKTAGFHTEPIDANKYKYVAHEWETWKPTWYSVRVNASTCKYLPIRPYYGTPCIKHLILKHRFTVCPCNITDEFSFRTVIWLNSSSFPSSIQWEWWHSRYSMIQLSLFTILNYTYIHQHHTQQQVMWCSLYWKSMSHEKRVCVCVCVHKSYNARSMNDLPGGAVHWFEFKFERVKYHSFIRCGGMSVTRKTDKYIFEF